MTVTAIRKDPATRTMTLDAEFYASADRVWQLWADPRQLERWWGPPTYPATVDSHDLRPGGKVEYHMTKWGQSLCPALDEFLTWAERQPSSPSGAQSAKVRSPRG